MSSRMEHLLLVVDDDADDIELICDAAAEIDENLRCIYAYSAALAWDYLRSSGDKPTYIFVDMRLPPESGKTFLLQLKNEPLFADIPVIMWSTLASKDEIKEIYDAGAYHYINKPNSMTGFREVLLSILVTHKK